MEALDLAKDGADDAVNSVWGKVGFFVIGEFPDAMVGGAAEEKDVCDRVSGKSEGYEETGVGEKGW